MKDYITEQNVFKYFIFSPCLSCPNPVCELWNIVDTKTGEIFSYYRKSLSCPIYRKKYVRFLYFYLLYSEPERFLTLTLKENLSRDTLFKAYDRFRKAIRYRGYLFEYFGVLERQKRGVLHMHILQKGDYVPKDLITTLWRRSTRGAGLINYIERINSKEDTVGYILKYVLKDIGDTPKGKKHYFMSKGYFDSVKAFKQAWRDVLILENEGDRFILSLKVS